MPQIAFPHLKEFISHVGLSCINEMWTQFSDFAQLPQTIKWHNQVILLLKDASRTGSLCQSLSKVCKGPQYAAISSVNFLFTGGATSLFSSCRRTTEQFDSYKMRTHAKCFRWTRQTTITDDSNTLALLIMGMFTVFPRKISHTLCLALTDL